MAAKRRRGRALSFGAQRMGGCRGTPTFWARSDTRTGRMVSACEEFTVSSGGCAGRKWRVIEHAHHFCVRLKYRKSGGG
jgi:hypothetical protein